MGWWNADPKGTSFSGDGSLVWGDGPADIMSNALDEIDKEFIAYHGRKPSLEELQSGLLFSAGERADEKIIRKFGNEVN